MCVCVCIQYFANWRVKTALIDTRSDPKNPKILRALAGAPPAISHRASQISQAALVPSIGIGRYSVISIHNYIMMLNMYQLWIENQ